MTIPVRNHQQSKGVPVVEFQRLNQRQFDRFRDFIYSQCGISIDPNKVSLLTNRIRRRLQAGNFKDFDCYYRLLTSPAGASELECFLDAITTNETFFYRTEKHFEWLKTDWLTEVVDQHRAGRRPPSLRIWSAGCANGAEAYSIALCLAENSYRLRDWSLYVLGTDISESMLRVARQGAFQQRTVENVSDKLRRRYFRHQADHELWQVRPEIQQLVEFKRHNLIESLPERGFDCVFIRNVLIYFDRESKRKAIHHLLSALRVGGYLVVGPSEGIYDMLSPLQKRAPFLYQKVDDHPSLAASGTEGDARR